MRRRTQQRWITISQALALMGVAGVAGWNIISLLMDLPESPWWWLPAAGLPGLLSWGAAQVAPFALARARRRAKSFRLTWNTPADWNDGEFRRALRNLAGIGEEVDIIWARDGRHYGCWLLADDERVLKRMIDDLLPGGDLEEDAHPAAGAGVVVLHWRETPPGPAALCQMEGVDGVCFRRLSDYGAVTALWGPGAAAVGEQYGLRPRDLLAGKGEALLYPLYSGDNPWPEMPDFPSSHDNPGLSSISHLKRTAAGLRVSGRGGGLVFGHDPDRYPVGISLPEMEGMELLRLHGQATTDVAIDLVGQAIRSGTPTAFLDGEGWAAAQVVRRMIREVASGRVLMCDAERPGQSQFRLNPLHLPEHREAWPQILGGVWPGWLRELGITPAGLGAAAYRHSQVAVMLTALLAAERRVTLDPAVLWEALSAPDFLAASGAGSREIFGEELWRWWEEEGRSIHNFDVHLRLGHLRERLNGLLDLPEYQVLWRGPYLEPGAALREGRCLIWRLPDPRWRLREYITSQLAALTAQLTAWKPAEDRPALIVLHELQVEGWVERLSALPGARVVVANRRVEDSPLDGALLLSRLERAGAERVEGEAGLDGIRASDLRRLPEGRLVLRRGEQIGTIDVG